MKKAYHFTVQVEVVLDAYEEDGAELPKHLPDDVKKAIVYDINNIQEYADNTAIDHAYEYLSGEIEIVKVRASLGD